MIDRIRDALLKFLTWAKIRPSSQHLTNLRDEVTRRESERVVRDAERKR